MQDLALVPTIIMTDKTYQIFADEGTKTIPSGTYEVLEPTYTLGNLNYNVVSDPPFDTIV